MPTAQTSNYVNIEKAVATLVTANLGMPCELGDFSKLQETTPCAVITAGTLEAPFTDRKPGFERLEWQLALHLFFDYQDDAEAHRLFAQYRAALLQLFMAHRYLDDGNTPYPVGYNGQALDCKILKASPPQYFEVDGKYYVGCQYLLWAVEQLKVTYP